jgi:hypothetical protein
MLQVVRQALDVFARLLLEAFHFEDLGDQHVIGLTDGLSGHVRRRVSRQSETVSSDERTMSRSSVIRRSKSSASSGERSLNQMRRVAGGLTHEAYWTIAP